MDAIFEAQISFAREGREGAHKIIYLADSKKDAIDAAYRWAKDRQKNIPDVFGLLVCVKVAGFPIGRIADDGSLRTGMAFPFHEWKFDWGVP
jgi:hypothetical protein